MGIFISRFLLKRLSQPITVIACTNCGNSIEDDQFHFCIKDTCPILTREPPQLTTETTMLALKEKSYLPKSQGHCIYLRPPVNMISLRQYIKDLPDQFFELLKFDHPIPADGVIKPHRSNTFWPAVRAKNIVKIINPDGKRQSYDKNIRYIAQCLDSTPEMILKTNPVLVGRCFFITNRELKKLFFRDAYLVSGYW